MNHRESDRYPTKPHSDKFQKISRNLSALLPEMNVDSSDNWSTSYSTGSSIECRRWHIRDQCPPEGPNFNSLSTQIRKILPVVMTSRATVSIFEDHVRKE